MSFPSEFLLNSHFRKNSNVCSGAQVLFHRFYFRRSLRRAPVRVCVPFSFSSTCSVGFCCLYFGGCQDTAMGCLFLACKLEENYKKLRVILLVFHRVFQRRDGVSQVQALNVGSSVCCALSFFCFHWLALLRLKRHNNQPWIPRETSFETEPIFVGFVGHTYIASHQAASLPGVFQPEKEDYLLREPHSPRAWVCPAC